MTLVERINEIAHGKNMTLASIERELGFGKGTIRKWDKNSPSCKKVVSVANLLQVDIHYLLTGETFSSSMADEYLEIINIYKKLSPKQQAIIKGKLYEFEEEMNKRDKE